MGGIESQVRAWMMMIMMSSLVASGELRSEFDDSRVLAFGGIPERTPGAMQTHS